MTSACTILTWARMRRVRARAKKPLPTRVRRAAARACSSGEAAKRMPKAPTADAAIVCADCAQERGGVEGGCCGVRGGKKPRVILLHEAAQGA